MIVKLLTEQHLEFLSLKRGCPGSSESTHVKMPHCWKSHVTAHMLKRKNFTYSRLYHQTEWLLLSQSWRTGRPRLVFGNNEDSL